MAFKLVNSSSLKYGFVGIQAAIAIIRDLFNGKSNKAEKDVSLSFSVQADDDIPPPAAAGAYIYEPNVK